MLIQGPLADSISPRASGAHPDRTPATELSSSDRPRRRFHRHAASLIAVALAVMLWGFGYKLSLYRPVNDPASRVPAAKLWVKDSPEVSAQFKLRVASDQFSFPFVLIASACAPCGAELTRYSKLARVERRTEAARSPLPSRSPPSSRCA